MNKEMIVSSTDHETWSRFSRTTRSSSSSSSGSGIAGVVGNVYKGRVSKVLPGMQSPSSISAWSVTGSSTSPTSSARPTQFDQLEATDGEAPVAADVASRRSRCRRRRRRRAAGELAHDHDHDHGTIRPRCRGAIEEPDEDGTSQPASSRCTRPPVAAAVPVTPVKTRPDKPADRPAAQLTIEELLKEGQDVVVQVVKEPLGTKGARITCHASIPGRFLVFMPTVDHVGVSRKIESRDERARLRGIVRQFREAHDFNGGVIIRTAAANRPDADILGDLDVLPPGLEGDQAQVGRRSAPSAVIYREQSLVAKLLRDLLTDEFSVIRIDSRPRSTAGAPRWSSGSCRRCCRA